MAAVTEASDVLYVTEMARKLGRTEGAIRAAVARQSDSVPPAFYLGKRVAWRRVDVDAWLAKKASPSGDPAIV